MRAACPGIPISLSTLAVIEPDPRRRIALVAAWTELPELVTANQGEDGILDLCDLLLARGIGIEAGLLSLDDAHAFVSAGIAARCVRAMVEPLDADPDDAMAHAAAIEDVLTHGDTGLEQIHHGDGIASWAVNRRAVPRGHGIRTGLRTPPCYPMGVKLPITLTSSRPPRRCSAASSEGLLAAASQMVWAYGVSPSGWVPVPLTR